MPLKAWVKMALDRVIGDCFGAPDLEFFWVGDDAVDPLQQAPNRFQTRPWHASQHRQARSLNL